jgi:signal peptidase I
MKPAKRWLAVVFSLLLPGLGHIYVGRPARAILIFALVELCFAPMMALVVLVAGATFTILVGLGCIQLAVVGVIAWDAVRLSEGERRNFRSRRALIAALFSFVVVASVVGGVAVAARNDLIVKAYRSPSGAMAPTLLVGDHFFADAMSLNRHPIARGDVVVFNVAKDGRSIFPADQRPDLPTDQFVKRVVGLPGDTVEVRSGNLYLNGAAVPVKAAGRDFKDDAGRALGIADEDLDGRVHTILDDVRSPGHDIAPTKIPEGRYFMMGDNRDYSNDSRYWGTIRREEILGRAAEIYWSWEFDDSTLKLLDPRTWRDLLVNRTRWDRIGRRVQ